MLDGFGLEARRRYLALEANKIEAKAEKLKYDGLVDLRKQGPDVELGVGRHPVVTQVIELAADLIEPAIQFDEEAAQYTLQQVALGQAHENPFSEERERKLVEAVYALGLRLAGRLGSSRMYRRLWLGYCREDRDRECAFVLSDALKRIEIEYDKRRARFAVDVFRQAKIAAGWLTVTEAATLSGINSGTITRAVTSGALKGNGKSKTARRIDANDFNRWLLDRSKLPELKESDKTVQRRLRQANDD